MRLLRSERVSSQRYRTDLFGSWELIALNQTHLWFLTRFYPVTSAFVQRWCLVLSSRDERWQLLLLIMFGRGLSIYLIKLSFGTLDIFWEGLVQKHAQIIYKENKIQFVILMNPLHVPFKITRKSLKKESPKLNSELYQPQKKALISVKRLTTKSHHIQHLNITSESTNHELFACEDARLKDTKVKKGHFLKKLKTDSTFDRSGTPQTIKQHRKDGSISQEGWKLLISVQNKLMMGVAKLQEGKESAKISRKNTFQRIDCSQQNSRKIKLHDLFSIRQASEMNSRPSSTLKKETSCHHVKGIVFKKQKKVKNKLIDLENKPLTLRKLIFERESWNKDLGSLQNLFNFSSEEDGWQTFLEKEH